VPSAWQLGSAEPLQSGQPDRSDPQPDCRRTAVIRQAIKDGGHGVLADAEVKIAVRLGALLEAALLFDLRAVLSH